MQIFKIAGLSHILLLSMLCGPVLAMNKAELIDSIAKDAGLSRSGAGSVLNAFVTAASDALKKGDRIALAGFGALSVTRQMSSPSACHATREVTFIPASTFNTSAGTQETPTQMAVNDIPVDAVIHVDENNSEAYIHTGETASQASAVEVRGWDPSTKKKNSDTRRAKEKEAHARSMPPGSAMCGDGEYGRHIVHDKEMREVMNVLSGQLIKNLTPAYDALLGTIIKAVNAGEDVYIKGFGVFYNAYEVVIKAPERKGRNPQTGKEISISAKGLSHKEMEMLTDAARRAARTGRNPPTSEPIQIKAKKVAKFKAGKALANTVK